MDFSRTVLKSVGSQDSKTVPESSNWSILSQENWRNRHQGLLLEIIFSDIWPENIIARSNPWCLILQFSWLKIDQFELSGTVLESWDPADFKTVLEKPKRWSFIGDINKNATGEFFLGHPVYEQEPNY